MGRGRFQHLLRKKNTVFALNITSMTDMFTIMLVFLLQNYADTVVQLDRPEEVNLASTRSDLVLKDAPQVMLTKAKLYLNNKSLPIDDDTTDRVMIVSLFKELKSMHEKRESDKKPHSGELLFVADRDLTYAQTKRVLYTASIAGFPKVQMVTLLGGAQ